MTDLDLRPKPPSAGAALTYLAGAAVVAALVVALFVMPAELGTDPTGFGRATGLSRLAAPQEQKVSASKSGAVPLHHSYPADWRSDVIEIPLTSYETNNLASEIEWKVKMKAGSTLVYSWSATGVANPEEFYSDLHSQSDPTPKILVMSHEARTGLGGRGALVAPFDGIHGWYLQNQSASNAVVHLKIAGFYEKMTPAEIRAAAEAAQAQEANEKFGPPAK